MVFKMFSILFLISVIFLHPIYGEQTSSCDESQLHNCMTKEEKEAIFRVDHDKVHTIKYQVVPLHIKVVRLEKSSTSDNETPEFEKGSIYLETFGENFDLYLEENNNTLFGDRTPVIKPYLDSNGNIKYDKKSYDIIPKLKIRAYQDKNRRAAVTIDEGDNGRINVNGHVNHKIIIRSIPERLHDEVLNKRFNLSVPLSVANRTVDVHHHIVIKQNVHKNSEHIKFRSSYSRLAEKRSGLSGWLSNLWPLRPTISPSNYKEFTAYPKVLIVLDHPTYLSHHKNVIECVRHMLAYWNAVDLRFREMEKPYIRLNIAGIIIATTPKVTPYMEGQKASATSRFDGQTLDALESYFAEENVTHIDYDIVVAFSPWGLVDGDYKWWKIIKSWFTKNEPEADVEGIANLGSICEYPRKAIALVKDGGDLFNTNVAAHEVGHILGAEHDPEDLSEDDPDYKSDWKHGYIMSYMQNNKNQMHWSDFSLSSMQKNLQRHESNYCVLQKPNVGTPYRKLLPGKILNRDEQCKIQFGKKSFSHNSSEHLRDCLNSYCYSPVNKTFLRTNIPVAEGSYCDKHKICIEGECVRDLTDAEFYANL